VRAASHAAQPLPAARGAAQVGFAPVVMPRLPKSNSHADLDAARAATFAVNVRNSWTHSWWMDPVFLGSYPADGLEFYGAEAPHIGADDFEIIAQPVDFLGINNYQGLLVEADGQGGFRDVPFGDGTPRSAFNWPITPERSEERRGGKECTLRVVQR